jgi:hypothetical protein
MDEKHWKVRMGVLLVGSSVLLAIAHTVVFRDVGTLAFYLALDVVFVPVQVLLVSLIIARLLNQRERRSMLKKLNMVIGAFFGEVGNALIGYTVGFCPEWAALSERLAVGTKWERPEYRAAVDFAEGYECRFQLDMQGLAELRQFLLSRRAFVLGLLQNPNLLEHERFTDLLWALCHLTEELEARSEFEDLPPTDVQHLNGDLRRVFSILTREWLSYMQHLKDEYPYMYSFALRTNPFLHGASPIVTE